MSRSFCDRRSSATLFVVTLAGLLLGLSAAAHTQSYAGPQPTTLPPPIAAPADTPYPGTITLLVDISNVNDREFNVHETIPVQAGKLTLLYPEWVPGGHAPSSAIAHLAGLVVTANGKRIDWVRDRVNVWAFHIDVPQGISSLEVNFQYLAAIDPKEGRVSSKFADLPWIFTVLYPAGHFSRRIQVAPSVRLPEGWKFATALEVKSQNGNEVEFRETTLNTLLDSPLYAGVNYKRLDLSTGDHNHVYLDLFADKPADLGVTQEEEQYHRNLVTEAEKLFNSQHYDHYDFLFSLSDTVGGKGLEHHQSSEDGTRAKYFTDWAAGVAGRDLLAHEYTHSWNGKFRRPADLWTPNYNVPMRGDLLWVYEGMTQYWGCVLTARSGLRTAEQTRDVIAHTAAYFDINTGRTWRPLIDTTNQPIVGRYSQEPWVSWQRSYDYYDESLLIWLEADTKIRELSNDKKSLDDFAKLFFGIDNGSYITRTYTLDDVVATLTKVQAFDWAGFLRTRVYDLNPETPKGGITNGGYKIVYNDDMPEWVKHMDTSRGVGFWSSLGFVVKPEGDIQEVLWNSPAFKAGLTSGMQLQAVNDQKFTIDGLREVIKSAEKNKEPIKLLLKRGDDFVTINVDYHDGLRYPHLERLESVPDRLDAILAPSK